MQSLKMAPCKRHHIAFDLRHEMRLDLVSTVPSRLQSGKVVSDCSAEVMKRQAGKSRFVGDLTGLGKTSALHDAHSWAKSLATGFGVPCRVVLVAGFVISAGYNPQTMKRASIFAAIFLGLFGLPFLGMGLAFMFQSASRGGTQGWMGAIFGLFFACIGLLLITMAVVGVRISKQQDAARAANPGQALAMAQRLGRRKSKWRAIPVRISPPGYSQHSGMS